MLKKLQMLMILAGVVLSGILGGCGAEQHVKKDCPLSMLPKYLVEELPDTPYACAEITVRGLFSETEGSADISWKTFETAQGLQEYISAIEEADSKKSFSGQDTGEQTEWLYYQCRMDDDIHALDLYDSIKHYDNEKHPLYAVTSANGKFYRYSQECEREIVVRKHHIYALANRGLPSGSDEEQVNHFLNTFVNDTQMKKGEYISGWILDEENLYWIDHESRETSFENPKRTFTEVKAIDTCWGDNDLIKHNFAMLRTAMYEIAFPGYSSGIKVTFDFAEEIPKKGYEAYLINGFCMDEAYEMCVTDLATGRILQTKDIDLCIEMPDTVLFEDLNGDGFPDMKIDKPVHNSGAKPSMTEYAHRAYMLWNPKEEAFEAKTEEQVLESLTVNTMGEDALPKPEDEISEFAPIRELPEDADLEDYYVLTDSKGAIYIPRDRYSRGGLVCEGGFHIETPDIVDNDYFLTDDVYYLGKGLTVFSLPVTNRMGENALTDDWGAFVDEVTRCSEELCDGRVSNLNFEKYQVEGGCDLYGYTFDFDTGDEVIEYAAFIRLGKKNMAEVIGVRTKVDNNVLKDVTRFIAASFEDFGGAIESGFTKQRDNEGADEWAYPELHNLFVCAMKNFVTCAEKPDKNFPNDCEISFAEPEIERAVRNALEELWQLDSEEKVAFENRPCRAGDLAVVTDLICSKTTDDEGNPVLYMRINGYKQQIKLTDKKEVSFEDLGNFRGLKTLELADADLTDYSFVGKLTSLRELTILAGRSVDSLDFLEPLDNLRVLTLRRGYDYSERLPAFSHVTDLSAIEGCENLGYLFLQMPELTDFSFLKSLPDLCTFELIEDTQDTEGAVPDLELLPNAHFIEFYGESVRFEP